MMSVKNAISGLAACSALSLGMAVPVSADDITLRIGSGHPPAVVYAGLMKDFFQPELKKRVEERTDHTINFVEGYSGSIVKVNETLEGVQNNILDIGGFCFCFEPSNLPLHAFQVMLPFGTMKPTQSLKIAQEIYSKVPYMSNVFEEKFNQKLLARIADGGYNLGTTFEWSTTEDLKGQKLAGAGLNLKWLEYVGATPVQSALPDAYTSMKTGVYNGWIMFPSAWVGLKLYEPGPYYTKIGFGSITWHGLSINKSTWDKLPEDVQTIMLEVAADFEEQTGSVNEAKYDTDIEKLVELGTQVRELPATVRADWANSLTEWPQTKAAELDAEGLPASEVLKLALETAEKLGYEWPNRYEVK